MVAVVVYLYVVLANQYFNIAVWKKLKYLPANIEKN